MVIFCIGIDLAAKENRPSGVSIIKYTSISKLELVKVTRIYKDDDLVDTVTRYRQAIVALDSPLSLPKEGMYYRQVDLELKRMGYKVLPPAWHTMKHLTLRAMKLSQIFKAHEISVIETHPLSSLKSSKCETFDRLVKALEITVPTYLTKDERDSIIAAVTCVFYVNKEAVIIKSLNGSIVILPEICKSKT